MASIKEVTDATFDEDVLKDTKPVLVYYWAEWCGPCRQLSPVLTQIAEEHGDKINIVKVNVDHEPKTTQSYGVMQVPTMNLHKDGEVVKQIMGAKPKAAVLKELKDYL